MKSVQIPSFSDPYFSVFGLNTEIYEVNHCIHSEYRKMRTRNNSVFEHLSRSVSAKNWSFLRLPCIFKEVKTKRKNTENCKKDFSIHLHFSTQIPFITSERELDYFHQNVNIRVTSQVAERFQTQDLRKMINPWNAWNWWETPKKPILTVVLQNYKKSAVKYSIKCYLISWICLQYFVQDYEYFLSLILFNYCCSYYHHHYYYIL